MDQDIESDKLKQSLSNKIFVEPATRRVRPYLVDYLRLLSAKAKKLHKNDLFGREGHSLAMDICGALVHQDAVGIQNDGWFNAKSEPVLYELLAVSGALDADTNQPEKWEQLFELAERLK